MWLIGLFKFLLFKFLYEYGPWCVLQVGESLLVDGTISVDGAPASSMGNSQPDAGGGSGGTIYIM